MDSIAQASKSNNVCVKPSSDDSNLEPLQRLLQIQNILAEKIVHGQDLPTILATLCTQIEQAISPSLCAIMLMDDQTGTWHVKAAPSILSRLHTDHAELEASQFTCAGEVAFRREQLVVMLNSETDPHWDTIREHAEKHGIQACWSTPIVSKRKTPVGAFAVFHREPRQPTTLDVRVLETAAHLAGLAIQHHEEECGRSTKAKREQDLFDSLPIAYLTSAMDGTIINANACAADLLGLPQHHIPGRSVLDLYSTASHGRKKAERIHTWVQHGLEVEREELEIQRPDGTCRWVSLTIRLTRDSLGNPIERRDILEDISNRKQAEHLLDEQKSILEMIARGQPLVHILSRLCQGIETFSTGMKCSIHQLKGATLHLLAGPSLPETYTRKIAAIEIGPAAGSCGTAAYRREPVVVSDIATDPLWNKGRTLALKHRLHACWSLPIFSSDNEVLGTMAMYYPQPCTPCRNDWEIIEFSTKLAGIALEQERDRAALEQSETRYRILYEDNPTMYFTVALDGTVRSVNQFGASQLGFTPRELLGTSVFSICHKEDQARVRHKFESYLQAPADLEYLEFRKVRKDGTIMWVRETMRLAQSADQEPVLLLVCEDITDPKHTKETLVSNERAIRALYNITSSPGLDFNARMHAILRLGCERFNLPIGLLTHKVDADLVFQFVHAPYPFVTEGTTVPLHETFCGSTMTASEPIGIEQAGETEWRRHVGYSALGLECYFGTKVIVGQETYGTLCFVNKEPYPGTFSEADKDFLQLMARWIGTKLERLRAREALEKNHAFLHAVLEGTNDAFSVKDPEGSYLMINSAGARLLGKTPAEVLGNTDFDVLPQEQAMAQRQKDLDILASNQSETFEERVTVSGRTQTYLTTKSPFHDSTGKVIGIFGNARDITDRKNAEDALRRSEERLRQVIDLVPHFIFAKDTIGRFILANQAVANAYGTTVHDLIGKTDDELAFSPAGRRHFRHDDLDAFETGKATCIEECITDAQGRTRHLHTTKIPFMFADSALPAILGVSIDITDRKQGEEALRLTQHVFDILPDHVSVVGSDYRYRRVNTVYEQVHGLPAHELIGKHIADLLGKQTFVQTIKPHFDRCLAGEIVSYEQWFQFHDGKKRFMAVTYSPLRSQQPPHRVEAVVVNSRDLTQRKEMEEALKESEGRLRLLLEERTRISQDLHDHVLQSIYAVGLIIAAIRKPLETGQFSEVHEFLDQAVAQVNSSIADIRGFIEGLPQDLRDVGDLSAELNNLVRSMFIPDGPTFHLRIDQEAADLLSKHHILHLVNIARESMSNCLRHAQASKGTISLARKNGHLRFEIRDNGIGFNHEERSHSGRGLINMKARSEHLRGTLAIHSAPNKGTRVIINIPISTPKRGK